MSTDPVAPVFPRLVMALPGTWVQVAVQDATRVDALLDLVRSAQGDAAAEALAAHLGRLRGLGGDQVLVSTSEPPSVVVTSWPSTLARSVDDLLALSADALSADALPADALSADAGTDPVVLPHRDGWPVVRLVRDQVDGTAAAYWVADPADGRVLSLEVSVAVPDFDHPRWRSFDLLAGQVTWADRAQEGHDAQAR